MILRETSTIPRPPLPLVEVELVVGAPVTCGPIDLLGTFFRRGPGAQLTCAECLVAIQWRETWKLLGGNSVKFQALKVWVHNPLKSMAGIFDHMIGGNGWRVYSGASGLLQCYRLYYCFQVSGTFCCAQMPREMVHWDAVCKPPQGFRQANSTDFEQNQNVIFVRSGKKDGRCVSVSFGLSCCFT